MNRRYSAEEYKMAVENIRKALPDVSITTDVIVGFPGETEEEFNETYKFLQDIKLTKIKKNGLRWLLRTLLVVVNSLPTEQSRNM